MIVIEKAKTRSLIKIIVPFILLPLLVLVGAKAVEARQYAFITLLMVLLSLLLFIAGFEKKKIGTRRLIIVAIMVALSVVGRFIPFFKPITAITVLTAVYLGGEAGFLTGALAAVISNFYFGQGPWTPFQMFAFGMIGLIAGLFSRWLIKSRVLLIIYGALAGILYSFIMDVWTVLWQSNSFDPALYAKALYTALPFTILYAVSNIIFLVLLAKPIGEKLSRAKIKYGI